MSTVPVVGAIDLVLRGEFGDVQSLQRAALVLHLERSVGEAAIEGASLML